MHDDFAIRVSLESSRVLQALSKRNVVVDLSVDSENDRFIFVDQRLSSSICPSAIYQLHESCLLTNTDDSQTLMDQDGVFGHVTS